MSKEKSLKIAVFGNVKFSAALLPLKGVECIVTENPVLAKLALDAKIPLVMGLVELTEEGVNGLIANLEKAGINLILISGYGKEIPQEVLDYPLFGSIEIRPSLIPGYTGKNAINHAVLNGDEFTGCSAFYRNDPPEDAKLLEVISQMKLPITDNDKAGDMYQYLFEESKQSAEEIIKSIIADETVTEESPFLGVDTIEDAVREMPVIDKDFRRLAFAAPTNDVLRKIRGLSPMPGAYANLKFRNDLSMALNILDANGTVLEEIQKDHQPGVAKISSTSFRINTADGYIELKQVQVNNKKQQSIADFIKTYELVK